MHQVVQDEIEDDIKESFSFTSSLHRSVVTFQDITETRGRQSLEDAKGTIPI